MTDKPVMVREMPTGERPREKLLRNGAQALSNAELLAVLLRTGTKAESVMHLAERVLARHAASGMQGLDELSSSTLAKIKGIGEVKAVTIAAAIELGKRVVAKQGERPIIRSPQDVADLVMARLCREQREHFIALLLSTKNQVLAMPVIAVGSLNAAIVHPREVFRQAVSHSAAAVIAVHNHPSGDPAPSKEDLQLTRQLVEAGRILDIPLLDHVVIGDQRHISLKEQGAIE